MTYIYIAIGLAFWIICGVIAAGIGFAQFQRAYPSVRKEDFYTDTKSALELILFGFIGLIPALFACSFGRTYGWLLPWSEKARKEAGL